MINGKTIIGIVPARSGSKGIPGKNIRMLKGKHLLGWAIEKGRESGVFDGLYLLTDSEEYAKIGKQYGAEIPFLEPAELAGDSNHVFYAMKWFLSELAAKHGTKSDYVVLLQPTGPGYRPTHIKQLVELVVSSSADAGFTVTPVDQGVNAYWQIALDEQGKATLAIGGPVKNIIRRRQLLPPLYARGGSLYVSKTECLLKDEPDMYGDDVRALVIEKKYAIDLDKEEDWEEAERIMEGLT